MRKMFSKIALVTGGTSGIGLATVHKLASRGAQLIIASRDEERGQKTLDSLHRYGIKATFVSTDVSKPEQLRRLMDLVDENYGGLDYLFNNAGIGGKLFSLTEADESFIDNIIMTNFVSVLYGSKYAIPLMLKRGGGIIVNNASLAGTVAFPPNMVAYCGAKSGVLGLTASIAADFADRNIRCYGICPWITDTPAMDLTTNYQVDIKLGMAASWNPSGRIVKAEEVADVVVKIFSGALKMDNGTAISIDSGPTIQHIKISTVEERPIPLSEIQYSHKFN